MTQDQRNKKAEQLRLAAHIIETGCEWEAQAYSGEWVSSRYSPLKIECDNDPVSVIEHGLCIRIKEWKLPDPPAGRKWHRLDWTQEMLPDGWRPLLEGEKIVYGAGGDEYLGEWERTKSNVAKRFAWQSHYDTAPSIPSNNGFWRTRRPLPEPGIPVPEGWRELPDSEKDGRWIEGAKYLCEGKWKHYEDSGCYATSDQRIIVPVTKPKKRVPLGPCDVVPGSVVRAIGDHRFRADLPGEWAAVIATDTKQGIYAKSSNLGLIRLGWAEMQESLQIKRPTDTEWQPCFKEVES